MLYHFYSDKVLLLPVGEVEEYDTTTPQVLKTTWFDLSSKISKLIVGLFDFLKSKKAGQATFATGSYVNPAISDQALKPLIRTAVSIFQNNTNMDQDGIVDLIKTHCNDEELAMALYRFIPIAYTRLFIPEAVYSDEYVLFKSAAEKATFQFSKDNLYNLIFAECTYLFNHAARADDVMPIMYHSAEFKVINSALHDGSELKNLMLSPAYFLAS